MSRNSIDPLGGKQPREMTLAEIIETGISSRLDHAGVRMAGVTAEDVVAIAAAWIVETALTVGHHAELRIGRPLGRLVGRALEAVA